MADPIKTTSLSAFIVSAEKTIKEKEAKLATQMEKPVNTLADSLKMQMSFAEYSVVHSGMSAIAKGIADLQKQTLNKVGQ